MINEDKLYIKIKSFWRGIENEHHVYLGLKDSTAIVCLTKKEASITMALMDRNPSVAEFLNPKFGDLKGLNFKESIDLLLKLYHAGFIDNQESYRMAAKLEELSSRQNESSGKFAKQTNWLKNLQSYRLMTFSQLKVSNWIAKVGLSFLSVPALLAIAIATIGLAFIATMSQSQESLALFQILADPAGLILKTISTLAFCFSTISLLRAWTLGSSGDLQLSVHLNLSGLCLPYLSIVDEQVCLIKKSLGLRYWLFTLLIPMSLAAVCWYSSAGSLNTISGFLAYGFLAVSACYLFPLSRSPLIRFFENLLVERDLLSISHQYLSSKVINDLKITFKKNEAVATSKHHQLIDYWTAIYASYSFFYLYVCSMFFGETLFETIPELLVNTLGAASLTHAVASGFILLSLCGIFVGLCFRLISIPLSNIFAASKAPLKRARRGIFQYKQQTLQPSEAINQFLSDIPILQHLDNAILGQLTKHLSFEIIKKGTTIIQQGDQGDTFYILADGEVDISRINDKGIEVFIDTLNPGDTFGEIALIQQITRQATIKCRTNVRLLSLKKSSFDKLFAEASVERANLTELIFFTKLIQDSQALSHLTPSQVQFFMRASHSQEFSKGDLIIEQGTVGECAYLICEGTAKVSAGDNDRKFTATLTKGDLLGMIALMKDLPRTANVYADGPVKCLVIGKAEFVHLCMQNLIVGSLVSELAENQLDELQNNLEAS